MSKGLEKIKEYTEKFKFYLDLFQKKAKPFLEQIKPFLHDVDRKLGKLILFIRLNKIQGALLILSCIAGLILVLIVAVLQEWLFILNTLMFLINCFFLALLCAAILYFISKIDNLLFIKALTQDISSKESKEERIIKEDLEFLKNMKVIADEWKKNRKKDDEPKIKM